MLHRGIKFVHAAVLIFSAMLAFVFVRGLDEEGVLGNSALVWVMTSDDSVSGAEVTRLITSFSNENMVSVAREVPDLKDPDRKRHLYLAPGGSSANEVAWLQEGYPAFNQNVRTEVHPLTDLVQRDPRGHYYLFGSPDAADELVDELSELGLKAIVSHPLSYGELANAYKGGVLYTSFWVITLSVVSLTGASVLLSAKGYGVLRLQGASFTSLFFRDLRQLRESWMVAASVVAALTITFLGFYNSLAWFGFYASIAAILAFLLIIFILMTHAIVLALTFKVDILRALKGELPARAAFTGVYLVRIPALMLALSVATSFSLAGRDILERQESQTAYDKASDAVSIRLNGSLVGETEQLISEVGPWLRRSDRAGEVIVVGRRDLQIISPESPLPAGEVLFVNETFLAKQPVLSSTGKRYPQRGKDRGHQENTVRLILPEAVKQHKPAIAKAVLGVLDSSDSEAVQVETSISMNGQRIFGYNPGAEVYNAGYTAKEDRSLVRDPVVVVIPNGSKTISDDLYTSFASQGGVVFSDSDHALQAIESDRNDALQTYVTAFRPVGQNAALEQRDAVNGLRLALFNLMLAVTVLLVAGIGVCIIYSRKNSQLIFVRHLSGWTYLATHRFILGIEIALATLLATRIPIEAWVNNQELKEYVASGNPALHPPIQLTVLDFGIIVGLVAVQFGSVLVALAVLHRRIVKEGATTT